MPKTRHIPERSCVACAQKFPKQELTRIVRTPQGEVRVDSTGKSAGRGAYLCGSAHCWERGLRKGGLDRGLRTSLSAQDKELLLSFYQQQVARLSPMEN
ncbi:MAG TPA: YlxR family protein [Dehalococcoidia bacterium]|nr:YlxR family protein [Dehalococcoidia bacterium]